MSKLTKRKHVMRETEEDLSIPTKSQTIVRMMGSRGNNLHEVINADSEQFLVSMPTKFRRNIWVKKGDFVLVEPIAEGDKVKAEIVRILTKEHIKWYKRQNCWPPEFNNESNDINIKGLVNSDDDADNDDGLFVNTNRCPYNQYASDTDSDSDDTDDGNDS